MTSEELAPLLHRIADDLLDATADLTLHAGTDAVGPLIDGIRYLAASSTYLISEARAGTSVGGDIACASPATRVTAGRQKELISGQSTHRGDGAAT